MAKKFIPNGDVDFWSMAKVFAGSVGREPGRFGVREDDTKFLVAAVAAFNDAYLINVQPAQRSPATVRQKETARRAAEAIIRRVAAGIRARAELSEADLIAVGMRPRAKASTAAAMANEGPRLWFKRAIHETSSVPQHELTFESVAGRPRPPGATRLELFVDLIPPDTDAPTYYKTSGPVRPIYMRSFTKSPIRLVPPMADVPMRVVYFARWADANGDVGPMSGPVAGWVEGGRHHLMYFDQTSPLAPMRIDVSAEAVSRETTVLVAMITGQTAKRAAMIEQQTVRQLSGMVEADAA